jgi:uncharacterized protein (DUF58 family)
VDPLAHGGLPGDAPAPGEAAPLPPDFLRRLEHLRLVSRRLFAGRFSALQRSRKLGRGMDFADHRPYVPGDDLRDVDWNVYGRTDRLMVRLAEEETELHLHLLVDVSRSMGPEKALFVRRVATALAYVALAHLDRVHLWPFGERLLSPLSPPRNKARAVQVWRHLDGADGGGATDFLGAATSFAGVASARGVALVISDFLMPQGWQAAVDRLRHARQEVALLQVSTPQEADPGAKGEVLLADQETGRVRRVRLTDGVLAAYRAAFVAHGEALASHARTHGLFHAHARTDQPWEDVVLSTMRTGRLLA